MKRYIRANTEKPLLDNIRALWRELGDHSGIAFTILSEDNELLFENLFDYDDVDSDAIYDSAVDLAVVALSQTYNISESALAEILNSCDDIKLEGAYD